MTHTEVKNDTPKKDSRPSEGFAIFVAVLMFLPIIYLVGSALADDYKRVEAQRAENAAAELGIVLDELGASSQEFDLTHAYNGRRLTFADSEGREVVAIKESETLSVPAYISGGSWTVILGDAVGTAYGQPYEVMVTRMDGDLWTFKADGPGTLEDFVEALSIAGPEGSPSASECYAEASDSMTGVDLLGELPGEDYADAGDFCSDVESVKGDA